MRPIRVSNHFEASISNISLCRRDALCSDVCNQTIDQGIHIQGEKVSKQIVGQLPSWVRADMPPDFAFKEILSFTVQDRLCDYGVNLTGSLNNGEQPTVMLITGLDGSVTDGHPAK